MLTAEEGEGYSGACKAPGRDEEPEQAEGDRLFNSINAKEVELPGFFERLDLRLIRP